MLKSLLRALAGETLARPPFWFMRQAGRYLPEYRRLREQEPDFLRFCYTPELATEAALQPLRRFAPDAAILFSDILVIPDALGCDVRFVEAVGPVLEPVTDAAALARLDPQRMPEHLQPVFDAVRLTKQALPPEVALIGFAGAPWTLALYMIEGRGGTDGARARRWAYRDPDSFEQLIAVLTACVSDYLIRQVAAGVEVVQLFDSWAGLLSCEQFERWVIQPTCAIVATLRTRYPDLPIIGFPRGAGPLYADYVARTGVQAVSIDSLIPPRWAAAHLQGRCAVQGNLDNLLLASGGPPLASAVEQVLSALGNGPLVFNLGHGILPDTPPEHVVQVAEQVRAYQRQER